MVMRSVGFQLRTDGKAEVKNDFAEVRAAGSAAMSGVADAAEQAGERAERAQSASADRQIAKWKAMASAAKVASLAQDSRSTFDMALADRGSGSQFATVNLDRSTGAAKASADVFRPMIEAEEQMEARTRALLAAIEPVYAAQGRFNTAITEAKTLLDAGRISTDQYALAQDRAHAALDAATGATKRAELGAAAVITMQARVNAAGDNGFGGWAGSAERSASAFRALIAAEEELENRTRRMIQTIDPAAAAQDRFNAEIGEARSLVNAGTLSLDQYCTKLRQEQALLDAASAAQRRGAASTAAHRQAMQGLSFQAQDAFTQISMGTNPLSVLAIQGGQAAGQMANLGGRIGAVSTFLIGPWGLAITAGMLALGAFTDHMLKAGDAADKTKKAVTVQIGSIQALDAANKLLNDTLGQSVKNQAQVRAEAIGVANANIIAANAARDRAVQEINLAKAMLAQTAARSRQGGERSDVAAMSLSGDAEAIKKQEIALVALEGKIAATRRSRSQLITEDRRLTAEATADRADADAKLVVATGRTGDAERSLANIRRQGRLELAAGTLTQEGYQRRVEGGERALEAAQEADRKRGEGRTASLGRQAAAMQVNASASLDLARAYLTGGDAAIRAEAARKGLTDATRKGIEADAQVARQLQVMVGEDVAGAAKSVAAMRDETMARAAIRAQVEAGTVSAAGMAQAMTDEMALRPLLKLQTVAQGEALDVLNRVIREYRQVMAEAHEEEAKGNATRLIAASKDRVTEIRASILDMSGTPLAQAIAAARRAAEKEADTGKMTGADRDDFINSRIDEARAARAGELARYTLDALQTQTDSLALGERELQLLGANDNVRSIELEKLRLGQEIRRRFPEMAREDVDALLAGVDAIGEQNARLKIMAANLDEVRRFGSDFVDTVLDEDTWSSWGNAGRAMTSMIKQEFMKLALLNPLKNLINGNTDLPTLGGFFGGIGKIFGGNSGWSGGVTGPASLPDFNPIKTFDQISLPRFATGTEYASGGAAWVGEFGPEILNVPRGSRITPAGESRQIAANDRASSFAMPITIDATGADAAGLMRVERALAQLEQNIPGMVLTVMQDAQARRVIR